MVFLCYFGFGERCWIAGEYLRKPCVERMFCNRPGRTPRWGPVNTPYITQNVMSQKGKGAELHTKSMEELDLVFIRLLHIYYTFQRLGCSGALLKIRVVFSPCWEPLLMAHQCLELLDCFSLCSHALISSIIFICLYTYFPQSSEIFFPGSFPSLTICITELLLKSQGAGSVLRRLGNKM